MMSSRNYFIRLLSDNYLVSRGAFCLYNRRKILISLCCLNVYIRVFLIIKWKKAILKRAVYSECDL